MHINTKTFCIVYNTPRIWGDHKKANYIGDKMLYDFNSTKTQYNPPPRSITLDPIIEKLATENHTVMLPWLAAISMSLSAIEGLTYNNQIKTSDSIDFYYHTDDILAISQNFTHNGKTFNLLPHAQDLLKSL